MNIYLVSKYIANIELSEIKNYQILSSNQKIKRIKCYVLECNIWRVAESCITPCAAIQWYQWGTCCIPRGSIGWEGLLKGREHLLPCSVVSPSGPQKANWDQEKREEIRSSDTKPQSILLPLPASLLLSALWLWPGCIKWHVVLCNSYKEPDTVLKV